MRRTRVAVLALLLVVPALLAGCFGATAPSVALVPILALQDAEPGSRTTFAFFVESTSVFKETLPVRVEGMPPNWTARAEVEALTLRGGVTTSLLVDVTPAPEARHGPQEVRVVVGDAAARVIVHVKDLGDEPLRAGIGAQVRYVLWYGNGTMIATNHAAAWDQAGLPWAGSRDQPPPFEPLKVYVGGSRGVPPPEPYNSTGCNEPPCYHPVIEGFDARLRDAGNGRGMRAGETLAVRVPAEKAYTRPGNEDHPLYGEDLHFLVQVVSVDILHPKPCALPVCLPPGSQTTPEPLDQPSQPGPGLTEGSARAP